MNPLVSAISLSTADAAAAELQQLLSPACDQLCVAGALRRRRPVCREIELVVVSRVETIWIERRTTRAACAETYDEPIMIDRLAEVCEVIRRGKHSRLARPVQEIGASAPHWGERSKDLVFWHEHRWLSVRLWICKPQWFGAILALRTGDPEFANLLVTPEEAGGAMPLGLRQVSGQLERLEVKRGNQARWVLVPSPDEEDFFNLLEIPLLPPEERTETRLQSILASQRRRREETAS